jgi:hypothetical protein
MVKKKYFGYFFDQENQVILCKFEEVLETVSTKIENAHNELTMTNPKFNSNLTVTPNKKRYVLKESINHKYKEVNSHLLAMVSVGNDK